jgi:hypothetical protein
MSVAARDFMGGIGRDAPTTRSSKMTSRTLAVLFALIGMLSLAACGGGDSAAGLNPAFAGTWNGTTTVTIPGYQPLTYPGQLIISLNGSSAVVSRVCPDGSGSLTMSGSGSAAAWTGTVVCPPMAVTCSGTSTTLSITLTSAAGSLSADTTTLTAQGSGTATVCGGATTVTFSFVGT